MAKKIRTIKKSKKAETNMEVRSKEFNADFDAAARFATKVGRENLINISVFTFGNGITCICIWYWAEK